MQPLTRVSAPTTPVAVKVVEQLSVTLAAPKAAVISEAVGLHKAVVAAAAPILLPKPGM